MSDISASLSLVANKNGINLVSESITAAFTMSGDDGGDATQVIDTTGNNQLAFPAAVAAVKLLLIWNADPTNYVQLSYTSAGGGGFVSFARLDPTEASGQPGGFFFGKPESLTVYARANTASCRVKWSIVEA